MSRKFLLASLFVFTAALSGCSIYFGDERGSDEYTYCDETGCYWCDSWGCYPEGGGEGWVCSDNYDCMAGCYCSDAGVCEEAGFCTAATQATDCPDGFTCDDRGSCVPEGTSSCDVNNDNCPMGSQCSPLTGTCEPIGCDDDTDCAEGCYCDEAAGACVETGFCQNDYECTTEGMTCDEVRSTCVPEETPPALCQAEVLCDELPPTCTEGFNPGIENGCWNGDCIADADCPDGAPVTCEDHTAEADCLADVACDPVYRGLNCTDPNGASCTSGSANCTCESFAFDRCEDVAP